MLAKTFCLAVLFCVAAAPMSAAPAADTLKRNGAGTRVDDPVAYFRKAAGLFKQGQRDEAVFWYYLGQLRFRAYVKAHSKLDPSGAPALLTSLMATMGPPINQYAYGDLPALNRTIDRVLAWDDAHPDAATPKDKFAADRASIRQGLVELRDSNNVQRDQIRAERIKNGLGNRD